MFTGVSAAKHRWRLGATSKDIRTILDRQQFPTDEDQKKTIGSGPASRVGYSLRNFGIEEIGHGGGNSRTIYAENWIESDHCSRVDWPVILIGTRGQQFARNLVLEHGEIASAI